MDGGLRPLLSPRFCCYAITPNRAPSASLLIFPSWNLPRPGFVGSMSRSNRASAGQHPGRGRAPNPGRPNVPG
jgi:hypothetical protein